MNTFQHGEAEIVIGEHGETIGRIVHFVDEHRRVRAAVVVGVRVDEVWTDLLIFGESVSFPAAYSPTYKRNHWSWPPHVTGSEGSFRPARGV